MCVNPGPLGGAWFWCAVSGGSDSFIRDAFPDNGPCAPGIYRVLLSVDGSSKEVLVDDWIPCLGQRAVRNAVVGAPAYGSMGKSNEMWSLLYGKACAKVAGSFTAAFASPLTSPDAVSGIINELSIGAVTPAEDILLKPTLQLAGIFGSNTAPYLPGSSHEMVEGLADELSNLAGELSLSHEPEVTEGLPQFLITPTIDTAMGLIVTGGANDLVATVSNSQGSAVASLTIDNMSHASLRTVTLVAKDGPFKVVLMTVQAVQDGHPDLDVSFDFDRENTIVELIPASTEKQALGSGTVRDSLDYAGERTAPIRNWRDLKKGLGVGR